MPIRSLRLSAPVQIAGEQARNGRSPTEENTPSSPVVVHRPTMRVVDGLHRLCTALLRNKEKVEVVFVDGTVEGAFVRAAQLNAGDRTPLPHTDRMAEATRIIERHPQWSDRRIAEAAGTSPATVASLRSRCTGPDVRLDSRMGRDGRVRPLNAAERRRHAAEIILDRPEASLREIAAATGIAVATARDVRERLRLGADPVPAKLRGAERRDASGAEAQEGDDTEARAHDEVPRALGRLPASGAAAPSVVPNLRRDPSLRFTEAGRTILQLLSAQSLDAAKRRRLADAVPSHRVSDVARAARRCAEQWLEFAREIELRAAEHRPQAG
ncbi:hypothetical protein [Streptomyces sp. NPDC007100]|uniref:hypothetical protein n=1 Tax=Streptomyces sp. NPDC007100 TaxID=3155602 RepID=UPI00340E508C